MEKESGEQCASLEQHIKRPMNAFMIWSSRKRREISVKNPKLHNSQISKVLGQEWRNLTEDEKQKFFAQAKLLNELHLIEHPDYKYRPKRRVKKKNLKHPRSSNHTECPYPSCHFEPNGLTSSTQSPDQNMKVQGKRDSHQQVDDINEATSPSEVYIKNEKADSSVVEDNIPSKESAANPLFGYFDLKSQASKSPLFPTCETRDVVPSKFPRKFYEDSGNIADEHFAMSRTTLSHYRASNFYTGPYQSQYHVLPYHFPPIGDKESALRYLPSYSASSCNCCAPRGLTREEDCLLSQASGIAFVNHAGNQFLYERRW